MKLFSKSVLALITAGVMVLPVAVSASVKSSQVDDTQVVITYKMEDLQTASGRAILEKEIRGAANKVCGTADYSKTRSLQSVSSSRTCYHEAVAQALTNLGSGTLQVTAR